MGGRRKQGRSTGRLTLTQLVITGTTPLLCHNPQLADPDNKWVREIATITGKRKKTEDDRLAISKLEWYGGLYTAPGITGPAYPTANIRKCIIQAAKVNKLGRAVERAVMFTKLHVSLDCGKERNLDALFANPDHLHRASVGINASRTMRTRPMFPAWSLAAEIVIITQLLDMDDFKRLAALAGQIEGLGDNRVNGYGRFTVEIK